MAGMTDSQVIQYATQMRDLLISHEKANSQIAALESYIQRQSQQTLRSTLQDSKTMTFHHLTKKSVANGIKRVYQQVSTNKWKKVTDLSALVIQQLDQQPELPTSTTSAGRSAEMDEMAPLTTQSFCQLYRSA
ncbi:uncharacterized protein LOC133183670 [Saccostrea echinata]|uniref:uncharacterized protein LOC133183670 n=1 Tax=Saccostrea echinata TaxID=191078 RepID=UPI002A7F9B5C|nr:uncharacterized protein LOC133183670 [Saccostrea echinata]